MTKGLNIRHFGVTSILPVSKFTAYKACLPLFLVLFASGLLRGGFWGFEDARTPLLGTIYAHPMHGFDDADYRAAVDWAIARLEEESGRRLAPGSFGRAAIKVSANSGDGMQTPHGLVRAVIAALEERGYQRGQLFIVDTKSSRLRDTGFLPPLSRTAQGLSFEGVPVYGLDEGSMWNDVWFYENPLPVTFSPNLGRQLMEGDTTLEEQRKSYLAEPLLNGVDFWVNLPVITDHPAMEVNGALANASLWSVSNRDRFFGSPANAPVAMAEIMAIPELLSNLAITIVSLERYQFIGGPWFNSFYARSEPQVIASADPVIIDAYAGTLINKHREALGFRPIFVPPQASAYAEVLGVGSADVPTIRWVTPQE